MRSTDPTLLEPAASKAAFSNEEAHALARRQLQAGNYDAAHEVVAAILGRHADDAVALHYAGVIEHRFGRGDRGLALLRRSVALDSGDAAAWNDLGNVLIEMHRPKEALETYRRALDIARDWADAHNNFGVAARKLGRWQEAEAACRRAIELQDRSADAWYNLSLALIGQQRIAEAVMANSRAIALWPRHLQARDAVARALALLGELEQAAELYREWLADEPDNPVVQHHLAACVRGAAPVRASDAYIEQVFDRFAASFDSKLASLQYRAPQLIADALRERLPAPARQFDIVDAGCGTGLVGSLVRAWARRLAGCDLSIGMLRRARERRAYDALHKAELVHYLDTQPAAFDVVLSADTLCYFGELGCVTRAARRALRTPGWFVFTVEALPGDVEPFRLQPHGRYAHSKRHVEGALDAAGFSARAMGSQSLRQEAGEPVLGWLVTATTR
jgi:predicted TPR repeat methyltransferase